MLIVSCLVLLVGVGVGYLMSRDRETASVGKILKGSPEGGAMLRPDYELRKP